jgi:hypothetical protein
MFIITYCRRIFRCCFQLFDDYNWRIFFYRREAKRTEVSHPKISTATCGLRREWLSKTSINSCYLWCISVIIHFETPLTFQTIILNYSDPTSLIRPHSPDIFFQIKYYFRQLLQPIHRILKLRTTGASL